MLGNLLVTLLLIALVYFFIIRKPSTSHTKTSTIFIYGLPDSGKTELFYQLLYNKKVETTSSLETNKSKLKIGEQTFELVDVPGHPSFLLDLKKSINPNAAIIFLIDLSRKLVNKRKHIHISHSAIRPLHQQKLPELQN